MITAHLLNFKVASHAVTQRRITCDMIVAPTQPAERDRRLLKNGGLAIEVRGSASERVR